MFGRKKNTSDEPDDLIDDDIDEPEDESDDEEPDDDEELEDEESDEDELDDDEPDDDEVLDEWQAFDAQQDWREDGPFDINEVDLDADDIQRLDFGSLVVTPFDGMQLQMQVNQMSEQVQSLLVVDKKSSIEVALFAAPRRSSMLAEVRDQMQEAADEAGGTMQLAKGPLGTEIRRKLPITTQDGKTTEQVSRTWLAQGPRWLLRGVVMGPAALSQDVSQGEAQLLFEFFCNLVVRRGDAPRVPGELIGLEVPESVVAQMGSRSRR